MARRENWLAASLLLITLAAAFLLPAGSAMALPWGRKGSNRPSTYPNPDSTWGYGTSASNYVQVAPAVSAPDGTHVNSIYVDQPHIGYIIEYGWFYRYGSTSHIVFAVWWNGIVHEDDFTSMGGGATHNFSLVHVPGGTNYDMKLDGVRLHTWSNTGINDGISAFGSERYPYYSDDNHGDFNTLQRKTVDGSNTWAYWGYITDVTRDYQSDPYYRIDAHVSLHKASVTND